VPTQLTTCPECGAPVEPGRSECAECGAPLAAAEPATPTAATAPDAPATTTEVDAEHEDEAGPPTLPAAVHQSALPIERKPVPSRELGVNTWYSGSPPMLRPPAGRAGLLSDVPVQFPRTRGGGLAVTGLLVSAVALLLPWAPVANFVSYFDAWGLGRPSTIVAFVAALVLLAIALEPVPLSMRTRTGWLPLLYGGVALGMSWSRIDGGLAFIDIGGWLFALGGAFAVVGGVAALNGGGEQPPAG
jgi:hypothetical protein